MPPRKKAGKASQSKPEAAKSSNGFPSAFWAAINEDPEGYYAWNLKRAKNGDISSAHELLHGFLSGVEQGGSTFPEAVLNYLYSAFSAYLSNGTPIEKALGLSRPAVRPKARFAVSPVLAVARYHLLIKRDGMSKTAAKERMRQCGIPVRNLERYDCDWNLIRNMGVEQLADLERIEVESAKKRR